MKKIEAIIRHSKLDEVQQLLLAHEFIGMTSSEVMGFGRQCGQSEIYRGIEYVVDFIPKVLLEVIVLDEQLQSVLEIIQSAARSGETGDGKIFISDIREVAPIRASESGEIAL